MCFNGSAQQQRYAISCLKCWAKDEEKKNKSELAFDVCASLSNHVANI